MTGPRDEWLRRMADAEDASGSVSVGGLMAADTVLRTKCHPQAGGRTPESGEVAWSATLPLEDGTSVVIQMGKKGRDMLFGMLVADCHDSGEDEPA